MLLWNIFQQAIISIKFHWLRKLLIVFAMFTCWVKAFLNKSAPRLKLQLLAMVTKYSKNVWLNWLAVLP
jgi:hypothetical protein